MSTAKRYDWAQEAAEANSKLVIEKIKQVYPDLTGDDFVEKVAELCSYKFEDIDWPE